MPRLLFVSACLTATAAGAPGHLLPGAGHRGAPAGGDADALLTHSMATALVEAGVPANANRPRTSWSSARPRLRKVGATELAQLIGRYLAEVSAPSAENPPSEVN
ncbi:hypothetical protein [Paractinoplanes durhamensis]|uniref:Uncharacterized protein n=1 Tax=Paractinoplanes durhamensis TaxID=113563 RepID=A0ABQ3YWZ5_9ACTN|nr:hypothetical protein [Actinoplanes durhamensis]GIE02111.1 hypothetical protein Adu01nite_34610 [Actinoplanes durhamensis]